MNIKREGELVLLCCGRGRCPTIKKSTTQKKCYELTDDEGGNIILTRDQLMALKEAVKELDDG